jgi:hypothetical protein
MKTISIILVVTLLYCCLGCFNTKVLTHNETIQESLKKKEEIIIITYDKKKYNFFYPNTYWFKNDTVYGLVKWEVPKDRTFQDIKISFHDIEGIEKKELDAARTTLSLVAIGGLIYAVVSQIDYFPPK